MKYLILVVCFLGTVAPSAYSETVPVAPIQQEAKAVPEPDEAAVQAEELAEEKGGLVTLDFKDADIQNVLRILSLKSGVNIVAGPEVEGTVTIRLTDVPWEVALEVVLRTYGYVYEREGNIIRVTTAENLEREDLITETFVLNYTKAEEVNDAIKEMLSERGRAKAVTRTNTLIVTDVATNVFKIKKVIERLDLPTPQAYVDSKVVRTELGVAENLGIEWTIEGTLTGSSRPTTWPWPTQGSAEKTAPRIGDEIKQFFPDLGSSAATGGTTQTTTTARNAFDVKDFPLPSPSITNEQFKLGTLSFASLQSVLKFLKTRSNTKVISNPRIVVLNNQTAKVQVGQEIGIPTFERNETTGSFEVTGFESRDVGVVLDVTPHINPAREILVELKPEVSSFDGFNQIGTTNLSAPQFTVTTAQTQVLIRDGETIAIGGMLTDKQSTTESKVPILGDLPFVGKAFRSKRETAGSSNQKIETLFFVTVTIVDTEGQPAATPGTGPSTSPTTLL